MTNHEYLKQQSAEWLADKLVKRINCSLCPVVDECIEMAKILGELYPSECRKMLELYSKYITAMRAGLPKIQEDL